MERKKKKLLAKLKELREETDQIQSIKKEIKEADAEQMRLGVRIFLLSWLGAVILPLMFFAISFVCAIVGMNAEILSQSVETQAFLEQQLIIFSSSTLAMGFMILLFVVRTIDSAARRIPLPEFKVSFQNLMSTMKCKSKESMKVTVCIGNSGEDIAEKLQIFVMFPPSFKVQASHAYNVLNQGADTEYPNYDAAIFSVEYLHIDIAFTESIGITLPEEKKTYEIPVNVYERKIGMSKHKLTIEVVD